MSNPLFEARFLLPTAILNEAHPRVGDTGQIATHRQSVAKGMVDALANGYAGACMYAASTLEAVQEQPLIYAAVGFIGLAKGARGALAYVCASLEANEIHHQEAPGACGQIVQTSQPATEG